MYLKKFSFSDTFTSSNEMGVAFYGPPGVPSFPQTVYVGDIEDIKAEFTIKFSNLTFHNLSSAFSLKYKVDFNKQKVRPSIIQQFCDFYDFYIM